MEDLKFNFISPRKTRRLMRTLVTLIGCLFLLIPIILLYFLQSDVSKLVMIVCSLVAFAAVTAVFTTAENWEVIAAMVG
jgi:uncharacterized membrane protein